MLILFSSYALAKDCQFNDKNKEVSCLREKVKELKRDLKQSLRQSQSFLNKQETSNKISKNKSKQYEEVIVQKNEMLAVQKDLIKLYKEDKELAAKQMDKYRLCCLGNYGNAIRFHVGLGATGNDAEAAAMVGVGIGNFNFYGILQDNNSGVMLGYQF